MPQLLLHNDQINTMEFVVEVLTRIVPHLSLAAATNIMLDAHKDGSSPILRVSEPEAVQYAKLLNNAGLSVSIERETDQAQTSPSALAEAGLVTGLVNRPPDIWFS